MFVATCSGFTVCAEIHDGNQAKVIPAANGGVDHAENGQDGEEIARIIGNRQGAEKYQEFAGKACRQWDTDQAEQKDGHEESDSRVRFA